jgi:hypothetical protein
VYLNDRETIVICRNIREAVEIRVEFGCIPLHTTFHFIGYPTAVKQRHLEEIALLSSMLS